MIAALVLALWQPTGIVSSATPLADVLARVHAAQTPPAADAQRHEHWTYRNGPNVLPVVVAVRGAEFRADVAIGTMHYEAGMLNGIPWRADGNGIAHATTGDEQGDAVDRLPHALLPFADADCTLAGEVHLPAPAWVVVDRPPADRAHWFFVDQASGRIVREQTREGKRVVTIDYDDFVPFAGTLRPRHWHVASGDEFDDIDARVDSVEPGPVDGAQIALPQQRRLWALVVSSVATSNAGRTFTSSDPSTTPWIKPSTSPRSKWSTSSFSWAVTSRNWTRSLQAVSLASWASASTS